MANHGKNRLLAAFVCGLAVAVSQLLAFAWIGYHGWQTLTAPESPYLKLPLTYFAAILHGEYVFPLIQIVPVGGGLSGGNFAYLKFVDLKTGQSRNGELIDLAISICPPIVCRDRLWYIGSSEVYSTDGKTSVRFKPKRMLRDVSDSFIYENSPAVIDRNAAGIEEIIVLVDGEWESKGRVVFPGENRKWKIDEQSGESKLVPRSSSDATTSAGSLCRQHIVFAGGEYHLFQTDKQPTICYRKGFDFVEEPTADGPVSALAPENAPAEASEWKLLDSQLTSNDVQFVCVKDELYIVTSSSVETPSNIVHRRIDGGLTPTSRFETIPDLDKLRSDQFVDPRLAIASDVVTGEMIVGGVEQVFRSHLHRLNQGRVEKLPVQIEGLLEPLVEWMFPILIQIVVVLIAGTLALIGLSIWFASTSHYYFGCTSVFLAPILRRSLARFMDLVIVFGPFGVHYLVDSYLCLTNPAGHKSSFLSSIAEVPAHTLREFLPTLIWLVAAWIGMVLSIGVWGITPGKWIFGVRVVRSTLRPCGIARSLLRELLLWFDAPQLLTALPGLMCVIATENRQRIGDLIADTIVIDANSS